MFSLRLWLLSLLSLALVAVAVSETLLSRGRAVSVPQCETSHDIGSALVKRLDLNNTSPRSLIRSGSAFARVVPRALASDLYSAACAVLQHPVPAGSLPVSCPIDKGVYYQVQFYDVANVSPFATLAVATLACKTFGLPEQVL